MPLAAGAVDEAAQHREEAGRPMDLVQDHQPIGLPGQVQLRLGQLGPVGLGFQIQVEGTKGVPDLKGQGRLARLTRSE